MLMIMKKYDGDADDEAFEGDSEEMTMMTMKMKKTTSRQ